MYEVIPVGTNGEVEQAVHGRWAAEMEAEPPSVYRVDKAEI